MLATIDSDYRGIPHVVLYNFGNEDYIVAPLQRVGQIVLNKIEQADFEETDKT